jgi:hypothetical protein
MLRLLIVFASTLLLLAGPAIAVGPPAVPIRAQVVAEEPIQTTIGHVRAIGDCNDDGLPDLVVTATMRGVGWFEYPDWAYHEIATPGFAWRGDDVEAVDIDGDGDDDVVGSNTDAGNVYVLENPLPDGDPAGVWPQHLVGSNGDYLKDVEIADFDGDGKPDIVSRTNTTVSIFLQSTISSWSRVRQLADLHPNEGMDVGDLDGDGDPDVVLNGFWLETPPDLAAGDFVEHPIDSKWYTQNTGTWRDNNAKVAVADIDGDGALDVLLSQSERSGFPVSWYAATDPTGSWTEHVIGQVDHAHTLQSADADGDGDMDVFAGQMVDGDPPYPVLLFINQGEGLSWTSEELATSGIYSGVVGDIGSDGDLDLVGVRSIALDEPKIVDLFENLSGEQLGLDDWTYIQIDSTRAKWGDFAPPTWAAYFGLALGDIRGNGLLDIVSGRYFYFNPGGDMTTPWLRIDFGLNVDAMLIVDVDGDGRGDVIAEALPDVYWLEPNATATAWTPHVVGQIPSTDHANSQCYVSAQLVPGGAPEIFLDGPDGTYAFEIPPDDPEAGNWPRTRITFDSYACGAGDIDGDGRVDVVGATYGSPRRIAWWRNPGDGSPDWSIFEIGGVIAEVPDRIEAADVNGDGRPDIIVTEERFNLPAPDLNTFWFEAPADPTSGGWTRHTVATQYSTNSLGVADMDRDGDLDIVTGEHKGTLDVTIWENDGDGATWTAHPVDTGHESHIGTRLADLDGDGDLDIVSQAFDAYQQLHLWRNDAEPVPEPDSAASLATCVLLLEWLSRRSRALRLARSRGGASSARLVRLRPDRS